MKKKLNYYHFRGSQVGFYLKQSYVILMQCLFLLTERDDITDVPLKKKANRPLHSRQIRTMQISNLKADETETNFIFYTLLMYCNILFRERHVHLSVFSCVGICRVFFIRNQYYQIFLFFQICSE